MKQLTKQLLLSLLMSELQSPTTYCIGYRLIVIDIQIFKMFQNSITDKPISDLAYALPY